MMLFIVLLLLACFQGLSALQWTSPYKNTTTVCSGSKLLLGWDYNLKSGETLQIINWFFSSDPWQTPLIIANYTHGHYNCVPSYLIRLTNLKNGKVVLSRVTSADAGTYTFKVTSKLKDGRSCTIYRQIAVTVADPSDYGSENLKVIRDKDVTADDDGNLGVRLTCGPIPWRGEPPVDVYWTTPSGINVTSTGYKKNYFYLLLDSTVRTGLYDCGLPASAIPALCLQTGDPLTSKTSLKVDGYLIRILLLETKLQQVMRVNDFLTKRLKQEDRDNLTQIQQVQGVKKNNVNMQKQLQDGKAEDISLKQQLQKDKADIVNLQKQLQKDKADIVNLQKQLQKDKADIVNLQKQLQKDKADMTNLKKQVQDEKTHNANSKKQQQGAKPVDINLKKQLQDVQTDNVNMKKQMQDVKADNVNMKKQLQDVKADNVNMKKQLQDVKADDTNMKKQLQDETQQLKQVKTKQDVFRAEIGQITQSVKSLTHDMDKVSTHAGFHVLLGDGVTVTSTSPVKFSNIYYNYGGAYDKNTGVFTAPVDGTYFFIFTAIASQSQIRGDIFLWAGDDLVAWVSTKDSDFVNPAVGHAVVSLAKGIKVSVTSVGPKNQVHKNSLFSGYLIHPK